MSIIHAPMHPGEDTLLAAMKTHGIDAFMPQPGVGADGGRDRGRAHGPRGPAR